jgi:hypothetical protein
VICDYGEIQMHQTLVLYRPPTFWAFDWLQQSKKMATHVPISKW